MNNTQDDKTSVSINVVEEQAQINKQVVEKAKVRIVKKVHEEEETVDASVKSEEVQVHKVAVNKYVDAPPAVRHEGNTMIVPVIKEVAVVVKKLLLIEEVYITKHTVTTEDKKTIPLRREEVIVERVTANDAEI